MTNYTADPSHTSTGLTLGAGDILEVKSGGLAAGITVGTGASLRVDAGGTAANTVVQTFGGFATALGGTVNGATIQAGAVAYFIGDTTGVIIRNGAEVHFYGNTNGTTVDTGGYAIFASGSTDNGTTIGVGGAVVHEYVSAGQKFTGDVVRNGGNQAVVGLASDTFLGSGSQEILAGGSAVGTIVDDGSVLTVQFGGTVLDAGVNSGGLITISGGLIKRTQLNKGAQQNITDGTAIDTQVGSDATQVVDGGKAIGTVLTSGASQTVDSAGTAIGTIISGGAYESTLSGGTTLDARVGSGGVELIGVGGATSGTVVSSGGVLGLLADAIGNATIVLGNQTIVGVNSNGTETLTAYLNGITVGSSVSAGGVLKAYQGGKLLSMEVRVGDQLTKTIYTATGTNVIVLTDRVYTAPGSADGGRVMSGGLVVFAGGTFTGHADSGALEQVGGSSTLTTINGVSTLSLAGYVVSNNQTVTDGVLETISSGGKTVSSLVGAGGFELILSGGVASGTTVAGGESDVLGDSINAVIRTEVGGRNRAGNQFVSSGGYANATRVFAGASQVVSAGGKVTSTSLELNGSLFVSGATTDTVISTGGYAFVQSGGSAATTDVKGGGTQVVSNGGSAFATLLETGGFEKVSAGGSAVLTKVASGANQTVFAGGAAAGTMVSSGGQQDVSGVASSTTLLSGGNEDVAGGGTTSMTVVSGGQLRLSGGTGFFTVVTSGGAEIIVANGQSFDTDVVSGTETVKNGTAYRLIVERNGQVAVTGIGGLTDATINGGSGTVSDQGVANGTIVTSNGLIVAQTGGKTTGTMLRGTAFAGFGRESVSAGGLAEGTQVSSGATQFVEGIANNTVVQSGGTEVVFAGGESDNALITRGGKQIVFGGITRGTMIQTGATEIAQAGAAVLGTIVQNGATMIAQAGAVASATVVQAGASLTAQAGAATYATIVQNGANMIAQGGAVAYATIVEQGGTLNAFNLATTVGTILRGGRQIVGGGDPASGTIISSGGVMVVSAGGDAVDTVVSGGGTLVALPHGSVTGTSLAGGQVVSSGILVIGQTGVLQQASSLATLMAGTTVSGYVLSGGNVGAATIGAGGYVGVFGGTLSAATMSGGTLELGEAVVAAVALTGSANVVQLDGTAPGATISGFIPGDEIVFAGASYTVLAKSGDSVSVSNAAGLAQVQIVGAAADQFSLTQRGADTVLAIACYAAGTLIATDRGERAVEALAIGDIVVTAAGRHRAIKWLGRRSYGGRFLAANPGIMPIRFAAGSLGDGLPRRDLLVSPEHAMGLDGELVPARCLVNGSSIAPVQGLERVDYTHIELDSHDVILAEGAASETFVDDGSRAMFHNAGEYARRYPGAMAAVPLPRLEEGPTLRALLLRLAARMGGAGPLEGRLDAVDGERITGWARDGADAGRKVRLRVRDGGAILGDVTADCYRADLAEAGIGDGRHAFDFVVPGGLSPAMAHAISVERLLDGAPLPNAPLLRPAQAMPLTALPAGISPTLRGALDHCSRERLVGWAYTVDEEAPVALQVLANGVPIARLLANYPRPDLAEAGIGTGRHSFDLLVPGGLPHGVRQVIEIRRESDGAALPGTPVAIEPATSFDDGLEAAVAAAVVALAPGERQVRVLQFLRNQIERLQQDRATQDGGRIPREAARRHRRAWAAAPAQHAQRALVVDTFLPQPGQSGGANALLSHILALQQLGYAVSVVAADDLTATSPALEGAGITVLSLPFYASVEEVLRRQAGCFDLVYLHRVSVAARYGHLVREHAPRARLVYSVADLHHVRMAGQAIVQDEPRLLALSRTLAIAERAAALAADAVLTHSSIEASLLLQLAPTAEVHCVPWALQPHPRRPALARRRGIAIIGNFAHAPNLDGALWFADRVMPLIHRRQPDLICTIAGRAMPAELAGLAAPGIRVLGDVADLRTVYDQVRLTVAPLRFGAGIKSKVLESFAAGLPCVMTPVAAEGILLPPGLLGLVGEDAAELAHRILYVHDDVAAYRAAARAGLALIRTHHTPAGVCAALRAVIEGRGSAALRVA